MLVGDNVKHGHHTVTQPLHYASMFVGDDVKHRTRCANALVAICTTSVRDDANHFCYIEDDDTHRVHTGPALTWVNAELFATLIYS